VITRFHINPIRRIGSGPPTLAAKPKPAFPPKALELELANVAAKRAILGLDDNDAYISASSTYLQSML